MKKELIRNQKGKKHGKYAIVRLDKLSDDRVKGGQAVRSALQLLKQEGILEYGGKGDVEEFFVIKLKDQLAPAALAAYAWAARQEAEEWDPDWRKRYIQYAEEVQELAERALAQYHRKMPLDL